MISNKNFINHKVLDLVELYNFDIKFVFIRLYLKYMNLFVLHLFLRTVDLVNHLWKSIFRGGCLTHFQKQI
jgi:hypothetical protein